MMNCWEYMNCQKEVYVACPAYPDRGLDCWKMTGTRCAQGKYVMASLSEKIEYCRKCDFYQKFAHKF